MDSLTRMRAFIDVVDAEGYSAAARKIGRSKALLSKYVRELEDELGTLLLNRTTRQLSLTDAGHDFYARATTIIRDIDSLADSVRDASGDLGGRLRVSAPRSYADAALGDSLTEFCQQFPDIRLDVHLDDRFVDLVEEGFDVAIRIADLGDSTMIARKLAEFRLLVCASPRTIERHGLPEKPADLESLPAITDTNGRWRTNWPFLGEGGKALTVSVSGPIEVNSPAVVKKALLADLGFGIVPDFAVEEELADGRLVAILTQYALSQSAIHAVYPHRRYLPARTRAFVDFMAGWHKRHAETRERLRASSN